MVDQGVPTVECRDETRAGCREFSVLELAPYAFLSVVVVDSVRRVLGKRCRVYDLSSDPFNGHNNDPMQEQWTYTRFGTRKTIAQVPKHLFGCFLGAPLISVSRLLLATTHNVAVPRSNVVSV